MTRAHSSHPDLSPKPGSPTGLLKQRINTRQAGLILIIIYSVGLVGLSIPETQRLFASLTPITLLLSMFLLIIWHGQWSGKQIRVLGGIALAGYLIEVLGVLTGEVFGDYTYGASLGPKLAGTPPLIGLNWAMLIYLVWGLLPHRRMHPFLIILCGALIMVAYDVILEPPAIRLDMWSWGEGEIPFQNYAAWFVISLLFFTSMQLARFRVRNTLVTWVFFTQTGFFLLLNILLTSSLLNP